MDAAKRIRSSTARATVPPRAAPRRANQGIPYVSNRETPLAWPKSPRLDMT
ncbi:MULTISPECIES: hypothetical protein [unclassified Streptomyces]|uniref:hypothetical protein n=1 Tax=unclassified Streptomyces TaxID=2593676 RepID=UPI00225B37CE|nr:hypothetical protein [Streptomyces sp. NBC_00401]MCX5085320.1 hypothetical protein [Streptomyces sp. NBC_00401]